MRTLLCRYLQLEASQLNFAVGPIGKLHLPPPEPLKFNATHSGNMILVAVSRDGDVGVDVEHLRPLPKFQELAERYYCQREIETLNRLAHDIRQRAFFLAWTRKEALLKGDGKGLTFPLCDVEVTLTPDEPARLHSIRPHRRRCCAVAALASRTGRWLRRRGGDHARGPAVAPCFIGPAPNDACVHRENKSPSGHSCTSSAARCTSGSILLQKNSPFSSRPALKSTAQFKPSPRRTSSVDVPSSPPVCQ